MTKEQIIKNYLTIDQDDIESLEYLVEKNKNFDNLDESDKLLVKLDKLSKLLDII